MLHGYVIIFSSQNLSTELLFEFLNFSVAVQEERGHRGGDGKAQPGQDREFLENKIGITGEHHMGLE